MEAAVERGRVAALRALYEQRPTASSPPLTLAQYEQAAKASAARYNLQFFSQKRPKTRLLAEASPAVNLAPEDTYWLEDLDQALVLGNEEDANRSVLRFFFQTHDVSRVGEVDQLLREHRDEEAELFTKLCKEYPVAQDGFVILANENDNDKPAAWEARFDEPILRIRRPTLAASNSATLYSPWE